MVRGFHSLAFIKTNCKAAIDCQCRKVHLIHLFFIYYFFLLCEPQGQAVSEDVILLSLVFLYLLVHLFPSPSMPL